MAARSSHCDSEQVKGDDRNQNDRKGQKCVLVRLCRTRTRSCSCRGASWHFRHSQRDAFSCNPQSDASSLATPLPCTPAAARLLCGIPSTDLPALISIATKCLPGDFSQMRSWKPGKPDLISWDLNSFHKPCFRHHSSLSDGGQSPCNYRLPLLRPQRLNDTVWAAQCSCGWPPKAPDLRPVANSRNL